MDIDEALEVFVRAFGFLRSFTHPYVLGRAGRLWHLQDGPRRRGNYRRAEFVGHDLSPEECLKSIRRTSVKDFVLCIAHGPNVDAKELVSRFKGGGFRYFGNESLMVKDLEIGPQAELDPTIIRIETQEQAQAVARAARSRQILPVHLETENPPIRLYGAFHKGIPVGWVRSVQLAPQTSWVSNLYVDVSHRRKGVGRALMTTMLSDDACHGVSKSVLLASSSGAKLYPHLGYAEIGALRIFLPPRFSRESELSP